MLATEGAAGSAAECAAAAGRVYDKLHAYMAPLVGDAGFHMLFARSAKPQGEFAAFAEVSFREGSTKLRECLQALDPAVGTESAVVLFGTFFALIATFIGERLTTQVLRSAWPNEEAAPEERRK